MTWRSRLRRTASLGSALPRSALARALKNTSRAPRFSGHFPDRDLALAACGDAPGYDDDAASELSAEVMCQRTTWDYPVIYWLSRLLPDHPAVLDAGGHMGSKYLAFDPLLDLRTVSWTVYDLPATIRLARARQARGALPDGLHFIDTLTEAPAVDVLLASGLLQYLDQPFERLVASLPRRPRFILLNKVAVGQGPSRFTLERIGASRVPYQIRSRPEFEAEIERMGYRTLDSWIIPELSHDIPTHPWMGSSMSCGLVLECENTTYTSGIP